MSRCMTAADIKRARAEPLREAPRDGSELRRVHDFFRDHRGLPVEFDFNSYPRCTLVRLTDFYGFDLRQIQRGNKRTGRKARWVFAGEWFGKVYVDYIAERIAGKSA